jgi:hypothetical protein
MHVAPAMGLTWRNPAVLSPGLCSVLSLGREAWNRHRAAATHVPSWSALTICIWPLCSTGEDYWYCVRGLTTTDSLVPTDDGTSGPRDVTTYCTYSTYCTATAAPHATTRSNLATSAPQIPSPSLPRPFQQFSSLRAGHATITASC